MIRTLYGLPSNIRFCDIWKTDSEFLTDWRGSGINQYALSNEKLLTDDIRLIFYLLYSRYGNSSIASNDINRFKYRTFELIFQYGHTWKRKRELQRNLEQLTEPEIRDGSKAIYNHAYNPGTPPSTATQYELTAINEQNTSIYKKGNVDAYAALWQMLNANLTNEFLDKFKVLFTKVTAPVYGLGFKREDEEEDFE